MAKVYQAHYKNASNHTMKHHGGSQTKVEKEARLTAKETGRVVTVDMLDLAKPSLKSIIDMLNGSGPLKRTTLCTFEPTKKQLKVNKDGSSTAYWKVKRRE